MKTTGEAVVFFSGLVFGTGSSILAKTMFQVEVHGKVFEKPLFQTFLMFVGMFMALPLYLMYQPSVAKSEEEMKEDHYTALEDEAQIPEEKKLTRRQWMKLIGFLAIPSVFDLVATAFSNTGLVLIDVSVYQLLKCTVIVFVAIVKKVVLSEKYESFMKFGILLNTIAVCLVASTSFFSDEDESNQVLKDTGSDASSKANYDKFLGVFFIVVSCLIQSLQYVLEEVIMGSESEEETSKPNRKSIDEASVKETNVLNDVHPLLVVGLEGFWGIVLNVFLVLPIAASVKGNDCPLGETDIIVNNKSFSVDDSCSYENTFDSFNMLGASKVAMILALSYIVVITGYNVFAIYVTFFLDSVWHAILDNFRPVSVWLTQLVLFKITSKQFGEKWTSASYLQLSGLVLLLIGTAVYNATFRLSCFDYSSLRAEEGQPKTGLERRRTSLVSTSPFLTPLRFSPSHLASVIENFSSDEDGENDPFLSEIDNS